MYVTFIIHTLVFFLSCCNTSVCCSPPPSIPCVRGLILSVQSLDTIHATPLSYFAASACGHVPPRPRIIKSHRFYIFHCLLQIMCMYFSAGAPLYTWIIAKVLKKHPVVADTCVNTCTNIMTLQKSYYGPLHHPYKARTLCPHVKSAIREISRCGGDTPPSKVTLSYVHRNILNKRPLPVNRTTPPPSHRLPVCCCTKQNLTSLYPRMHMVPSTVWYYASTHASQLPSPFKCAYASVYHTSCQIPATSHPFTNRTATTLISSPSSKLCQRLNYIISNGCGAKN